MDLSKVEKRLEQESKDWTATDPHFLRQRLKLIFAIGLAASATAFLMDYFVSPRYGDLSWNRFASYNDLFISVMVSRSWWVFSWSPSAPGRPRPCISSIIR